VARTFEDLEGFYLSEERQRRLAGMGWGRRWLHRIAWLFKSLFMNLTPARRVLLALALLLLCARAQWRGNGQSLQIDFGGLPVALLLLLLMLELKDKLVARSELQAGRAIQQALLPKEAPQVPGWDVWISTRPANDVGGDLIDFVTHEDGRVGLALADVSGKGLPAALPMARLQAAQGVPQAGPGEPLRDPRLPGTRAGVVADPSGERGAHASAGRRTGSGPAAARGRPCARHPHGGDVRGAIGRSGCGRDPPGVLRRRDRCPE
jgi:hypothetical protein